MKKNSIFKGRDRPTPLNPSLVRRLKTINTTLIKVHKQGGHLITMKFAVQL